MISIKKILKGLLILEENTLTPKEIEILPGGTAGTKTTLVSSQTSNLTLTLPSTAGTNGQVLQTDGSGILSFVDAGGGGGSSSSLISALDVDWSLATAYYKSITADSTFTFSNLQEGKTITVALTNATGTAYNITFPTTKKEGGGGDFTLYPNSDTLYVFVRINGITYASTIVGVI